MTKKGWDARCLRCGRCCYEKIEYNNRVYYTDKPCDKLDLETLLCSVYDQRHTAKPECMPLDQEMLRYGILPADCPYVADIVSYNAPQLWDEADE